MKNTFKFLTFLILFAFLMPSLSLAERKVASEESPSPLQFTARGATLFPFWLGVEGEVLALKHYSLSFGYGYIPGAYSSLVGSTVGNLAGNAAYQTLVTSMLQQNSALKITGEYKFNGHSGWFAGGGALIFNASGDASIVDVLEALTGQSYTGLKTILSNQGRSLVAHAVSTIFIGELHGGYSWEIGSGFHARTSLGIAKVLSSAISLSSNAPAFDNSLVGQNAYATSISSIQSTLASYGISPIIEGSLSYSFN